MKIVLKKVRKRTPFSWLEPIKVEPLELEYLKAALATLPVKCVIVDPLFDQGEDAADIVVLNGYNTARGQMLKEAKRIKTLSPKTIVIGSGVDVQVNWALYKDSAMDYLMVTNRLSVFKAFIEAILLKQVTPLDGVYSIKGQWPFSPTSPLEAVESMIPSRDYFNQVKHQTRYLLYDQVALVKRSLSCPFSCDFCYCKQLNQGHFVTRSFDALQGEMASVAAQYFWVVDDVFVHNAAEAEAFLAVFKDTSFKMIVYLRADFVARHPEFMEQFKQAGVVEVIIGFESIKASFLKTVNKGYQPDVNTEAIGVLETAGLSYCALFMVDIQDRLGDFTALKRYIRKHQIPNYTFSIFTPLEGTKLYDAYAKEITDFRPEHYDFLHLVLKPKHLPKLVFQLAFIQLFVFQLLHSREARRFLMKRTQTIFQRGKG